jgi:zinc transport system substrate-binding protein
MAVIDCSRGIDLMQSDDPDEPGLDPHIWTSPHNVKIMVNNICAGLTLVDPEGRSYFASNRDAYSAELDRLDADIRAALTDVTSRTFIVYHPAWGYFARDYGLKQLSIEQEGKEPKAAYLARLVQEAKIQGIRIIFISPAFDARNAEAVAREINGKVIIIDPLSKDYLNNMRDVARALKEALKP